MRVLSTGVKYLDDIIGGIPEISTTLLIGPPGSGKTLLATQFLVAGAIRGENVLYISLDESAQEYVEDFRTLDLPLEDVYVFDAVPAVGKKEIKPFREISIIAEPIKVKFMSTTKKVLEVDVLTLLSNLKSVFDKRRYDRIVVDSLTSLKYFYTRGLDEEASSHAFVNFLRTNANSSVIIIAEDFEDLSVERASVDNVFYLRPEKDMSRVYLVLEKFSMPHNVYVIPLVLGDRGFEVEERFYRIYTGEISIEKEEVKEIVEEAVEASPEEEIIVEGEVSTVENPSPSEEEISTPVENPEIAEESHGEEEEFKEVIEKVKKVEEKKKKRKKKKRRKKK